MKLPAPHLQRPWRRACGLMLCAAMLCTGLAGCKKSGEAMQTAESAETATMETAEEATAETADAVAVQAGFNNSTVLPKTADAGKSYVDETLFIGDSNTARYMMYADETGAAFTTIANNIGVVSMGVESITGLKCEQFKGYTGMFTIPDSVGMLKPKRIVIGFGTNNLAGSSTDATNFISKYSAALASIEKAWQYADILVSAIPPLDKQRDNTNLTMTQIDAYNAALVTMCEENGYKFLNSTEVLKDGTTGWAKKDYTLSDGVHLSQAAVSEYFTYLRTHAYITDDRRPQPLGNLPTPNGSPVGLISADPIAVRGAKVPVEFVAASGGSLRGYTSQKVKKGGTCSAVTAVPDSGWKFAYWSASYGTVGGGSTLSFTVPSSAGAGGVVVTAHFTADQHDHDYQEVAGSRTEPGCLNAGVAKYACTICGAVIEKELPALGHQWDGGVVTQQPQVGVPGVKTYTCTRGGCNSDNGGPAKKTESIPALAGTPSPSPSPAPTSAPTQAPSQGPTAAPTPQATPAPTQPPAATPAPTPEPPPPTQAPEPTAAPTEAPPEPTAAPPDPTAEPAPEPPAEQPPAEQPPAEPAPETAPTEG